MHVSMLELARSGRFGRIEIGAARRQLLEVLPPPSSWSAGSAWELAEIWKYGQIELHFAKDRLWMVFSDSHGLSDGSPSLEMDAWVLRRGLPRTLLEDALREEQIDYSLSQPAYDKRQCVLSTEAGVRFTFMETRDDPQDELGLVAWDLQGER
ncbi:MAG: hypothetical protein QOH06_5943 [Acidobacteriota bacterium]|jgi:hypothetical protein|nr:hypothetical protein [Acidobacteriota bacterium]